MGTVVTAEEQMYTLAEAEVLLRARMRQDMCMAGAGAPGHMVVESLVRNGSNEITAWSLGCQRCGAAFVASFPA